MAFDTSSGEEICRNAISQDSVIQLYWHPTINQIFAGSADSNIRVLYDPSLSKRGITTSLTKLERRKAIDT